jgi:ABC-type thiamine transport system substrate-binding protein
MAFKLDEKTEIQVSLKTVIALIVAIVVASTFVFHIEERIDLLEMKIKDNSTVMDDNTQFRMNWSPPPEVKETIKTTYQQNERIAVLEKHIEMLEQQIQELRQLR